MRLETQLQALAMIGTGLSVILSNERHVFSISEITSLVAAELVSEVSAPLSAAKLCDDRRNNT